MLISKKTLKKGDILIVKRDDEPIKRVTFYKFEDYRRLNDICRCRSLVHPYVVTLIEINDILYKEGNLCDGCLVRVTCKKRLWEAIDCWVDRIKME